MIRGQLKPVLGFRLDNDCTKISKLNESCHTFGLLAVICSCTLGISEFTELDSRMVVRMVVMLSDILAGTAVGVMKNVHQDNTTRITSGTYTAEIW